MPISTLWQLEWLNSNENRSYPLAEWATKQDVTDTFTLPDSFICEIYLAVHAGLAVEPQNFFLYSVSVFATGYSLSIAYDNGSDAPPVVATVSIDAATHTEYQAYRLIGDPNGDFADCEGKVVIGDLTDINLQPSGQFFFSPQGGQLDVDCVRPQIRGVSSLVVVSGNATSPRIYGDIQLVAGDNMQITVIRIGSTSQIRLDAIDGAGLTSNCSCEGDVTPGPPIQTINGVSPDAQGNFTLLGNSCVSITAAQNGLILSDSCSTPCCGETELAALSAELQHFGDQATTLQNIISQLQGSVDQTNAVILGSRIGDSGCVSC